MTSSALPWRELPERPRSRPGTGSAFSGRPAVAAARARIAARLLRAGVRGLPVRVELADGRRWGAGGPGDPVMAVARPDRLFRRLAADANIGLGEAYQAGDWSSPEPAELLTVLAGRLVALPPAVQRLRLAGQRIRGRSGSNTASVARDNAAAHYDLSNELFATFLDETMTYSGARFGPADGDADLARAQLRKIDGVLDAAGVRAGAELLEIGTGWGELSIRAARRGATVTSLTLSVEQQRLARERIRAAGVADRVRVLLADYREAVGRYDAVVSVEMIEAVGAEHWPAYFGALAAALRPGGRVGLQAITMPHERMLVNRRAHTWISEYVFPGGLIPSVRAIEAAAAGAGLRVRSRVHYGADYARTLRLWRERFLARWDAVAAAGFDETFRRTWEYYLAYSEAGFRAGYLDVGLFGLSR